MDALVKVLELGAKYAWAVFFVSAFVLLIPDNVAARLDLLILRKANAGYFWLLLLFTGFLSVSALWLSLWKYLWKYLFCPIKKLVFPAMDLRSNIKQSRIRYYKFQFSYRNGDMPIYFEAITSNGYGCGFFDDQGRRVLPTEPNNGGVRLDEGRFQHPRWARIDCADVFNGNLTTGTWGIIDQ